MKNKLFFYAFIPLVYMQTTHSMLQKYLPTNNQSRLQKKQIFPIAQICPINTIPESTLVDVSPSYNNVKNQLLTLIHSQPLWLKRTDDQKMFIQFFSLPDEIAKMIIGHLFEHDEKITNYFYSKPIKTLIIRSLLQNKFNNDKKLSKMITFTELCLMPQIRIFALYDMTKHFAHNPNLFYDINMKTARALGHLPNTIKNDTYFDDKAIILDSLNPTNKFSFKFFLDYIIAPDTTIPEGDIHFVLQKTTLQQRQDKFAFDILLFGSQINNDVQKIKGICEVNSRIFQKMSDEVKEHQAKIMNSKAEKLNQSFISSLVNGFTTELKGICILTMILIGYWFARINPSN